MKVHTAPVIREYIRLLEEIQEDRRVCEMTPTDTISKIQALGITTRKIIFLKSQ
jgi:hypothetical protein